MRVGVPAGGLWAGAGPTAIEVRAAITIFRIIQTPCFRFSRGDSQEMATRSFRSHSGELQRSGRAVRQARNGNPSTSESADLVYHLVALWHECGMSPDEVWAEMRFTQAR